MGGRCWNTSGKVVEFPILMRELGYSEQSSSAIKEYPTKWFELVPGSSKSDLANFVCR